MTTNPAGERVVQSINRALHDAFGANDRLILIGEDVLDPYGGAFKVTRGLSSAYPQRVFTTPISEAAIVGIGSGLAIKGYKPVVELMFGDFISLAFDQILNGISKFHSMYAGQVSCPIVIRLPMGGRRGYGPTHSQTLEKFFVGIPNLTVISPSIYHDMYALYRRILHEKKDPILLIENKLMYSQQISNVPPVNMRKTSTKDDYPVVTLVLTGVARSDVTLVAYGGMAHLAVEAAYRLFMEEEIMCEVCVPSKLAPLDIDWLEGPLSRSGKLFLVEEGTERNGISAEIGFKAQSRYFNLLKAPIWRCAAPDDCIPSSKQLENSFLPSVNRIMNEIKGLVRKA